MEACIAHTHTHTNFIFTQIKVKRIFCPILTRISPPAPPCPGSKIVVNWPKIHESRHSGPSHGVETCSTRWGSSNVGCCSVVSPTAVEKSQFWCIFAVFSDFRPVRGYAAPLFHRGWECGMGGLGGRDTPQRPQNRCPALGGWFWVDFEKSHFWPNFGRFWPQNGLFVPYWDPSIFLKIGPKMPKIDPLRSIKTFLTNLGSFCR